MPELRDPKEITLTDGEGRERKFIISKMNAWDGLEIMARWPTTLAMSAIPKLGDWAAMQEIIQKVMKFVAVEINGKPVCLTTQALIDNHTGDWKCLKDLLEAEVQYNNGFFPVETVSNFFAAAFQIALRRISETLNHSSEPSSPISRPASTS